MKLRDLKNNNSKYNYFVVFFVVISIFLAVLEIYKSFAIYSAQGNIEYLKTQLNSSNEDKRFSKAAVAVNDEEDNMAVLSVVDKMYPVGSIYMTTTEDTADKVSEKLGGSWERFAEGKTLISANTDYPIDTTGGTVSETYTPAGSNTATAITVAQLPSHTHTFTGTAVTSGSSGNLNHRHYNNFTSGGNSANPTINWNVSGSSDVMILTHNNNPGTSAGIRGGGPAAYTGYINNPQPSGTHVHSAAGWTSYVNNNASNYSWVHAHTVTAAGTNANTGGGQAHNHTFTGTAATISHMQPYQTTYMYKRGA